MSSHNFTLFRRTTRGGRARLWAEAGPRDTLWPTADRNLVGIWQAQVAVLLDDGQTASLRIQPPAAGLSTNSSRSICSATAARTTALLRDMRRSNDRGSAMSGARTPLSSSGPLLVKIFAGPQQETVTADPSARRRFAHCKPEIFTRFHAFSRENGGQARQHYQCSRTRPTAVSAATGNTGACDKARSPKLSTFTLKGDAP